MGTIRGPDLHVVSLRYAVEPDEGFSYNSPPPVSFDTPQARFRLADGSLTCDMKMHFSDVKAARDAVEPILRAWEADSDLRHNRGQLRFKFDAPEVIDRSPTPPGSASLVVSSTLATTMAGSVSVHVASSKYPDPPPEHFRLDPDAETLLDRYYGYLDHREPLPSMAYFCETVLEAKAGGRKKAAAKYVIDVNILNKIGELSSTRGDDLTSRKAAAAQPLSSTEAAWLEAAIKLLIRRLADTRALSTLPILTMADLPSL